MAGWEESLTKKQWRPPVFPSPKSVLLIPAPPALALKLVSVIHPPYDSGPSQAATSVLGLGTSLLVLEPFMISVSVSYSPLYLWNVVPLVFKARNYGDSSPQNREPGVGL